MSERKRRLAVISGFDSQFKWGGAMARRFFAAGYAVDFFCPTVRRNQISSSQLRSYGIPFPVHWCTKNELFETIRLLDYDVVLFSLPAGLTEEGTLGLKRTFEDLQRRLPDERALAHRPVIVAGFVGVNYENRIGSVAARRLADIILANSDHERQFFEDVAEQLGLAQPRFVTGGLGLIDSTHTGVERRPTDGPIRVLYAAQPTVPRTKMEKVYLLLKLRELAVRQPEWTVVVKPRHRPEEETFHRDDHQLEPLFAEFFHAEDVPANFRFDYRTITRQLEETDLLLTVSSTAALEAYARGVGFGILTDFGIKEPYGASFFGDSGALTSFAQLIDGRVPVVDPGWAERNVAYADDRFETVLETVHELLESQRAAGRMLPFVSSSYDRARWDTIRFIEEWRSTRRKVPWIRRISSGRIEAYSTNGKPARPRPTSRSTLETWRRKTRKLLRDPVSFVRDSRYLR